MVSLFRILGAGSIFVLWPVWPLLPERLPSEDLTSVNMEGSIAMVMLGVIVGGFGKLMTGK